MGTFARLRNLENELDAGPEAPDSQEADPEFAPIHFNDDFRKAKRNSLFWSTLSIVAAIGAPNKADGRSEVSLFQLGLSYEHWEIIVVCLIASTFMIFGYFRSARTLKLLNSMAFRKRKLSDFSRIIAMLSQDAVSLGARLDDVSNRAGELRAMLPSAGRGDFSLLEDLESSVAEISADLSHSKFLSGRDGQAPQLVDIEERRRLVDAKLSQLNSLLVTFRKGVPEDWLSNHKSLEAEMLKIANEAVEGSKALSGFDEQIGQGERRWHFWYDLVPVYGCYFLATVWCIKSLI